MIIFLNSSLLIFIFITHFMFADNAYLGINIFK